MDTILILDYGSQYTQLIARRIREQHVYSEIVPFTIKAEEIRARAPKGVPRVRKAYLVLMLTDENYALEAACPLKDPRRNLYYCTALSVLNHSYWVVGLTVGAVVVSVLGHVVDPDRLRAWTNGMEFSMAALFIVIFTDQMRARFGGRGAPSAPK